MKNYVLYARKSTRPEDRQAQSLPDQLRELEEYSQRNNINIVETFIESKSAYTDGNRPVFTSMITYLRENQVKGIITRSLDRASRNLGDTAELWQLIEDGVIEEVLTPTRVYDKNSFPIFGIESVMSKEYSRQISIKVRASIESRLNRGIAPFPPPVGYIYDPSAQDGQKTHVPDPQQFERIRELFTLFMTGNYSVHDIHQKAITMGIRTRNGRPISRSQTYRVISNPFYAGKFEYKGITYEGTHEPMLTSREYALVQEVLLDGSRPRTHKHTFTLNGLVHCGECGRQIYGETHTKTYKNGTKQTFNYYRCSKRNTTCKQPFIRAEELEAQVVDYFQKFEGVEQIMEWAIKYIKREHNENKQNKAAIAKSIQQQLEAVDAKIDALVDEKLSGVSIFEPEVLEKRYTTLKQEKEDLLEKQKQAGKQSTRADDLTIATFNYAARLKKKFTNGSVEDKKTIIRAFGTNLTLKDKKLSIQPRIPFLIIEEGLTEVTVPNYWYEPESVPKVQHEIDLSTVILNSGRG